MAAKKLFTAGDSLIDDAVMDLAKSAGAIHGAYLQEMLGATGDSKGDADDLAFTKDMIDRLVDLDLVTAQEARVLASMANAVTDHTKVADSVKRVKDLARRIEKSAGASPVAVAVAGVAVNSITTVQKEKSGSKGTSAADLAGALTGGNIGKNGGPWGAVIGVVVGAVGMSYLATRDEKKKDKKGQ